MLLRTPLSTLGCRNTGHNNPFQLLGMASGPKFCAITLHFALLFWLCSYEGVVALLKVLTSLCMQKLAGLTQEYSLSVLLMHVGHSSSSPDVET